MDKRLEAVPISDWQLGFRPVDGCRDHTLILQALLEKSRSKPEPLFCCFIDVSDAFGSVAHSFLEWVCKAKGLPVAVSEYLASLYRSSYVSYDSRPPVKLGGGVRQGDPLSGVLFNLGMDFAYSKLDSNVGISIGGQKVRCLMFADDAVLFASTPIGLQRAIENFGEALASAGMKLNARKCATLSMAVVGGRNSKKRSFVDNRIFNFRGAEFACLGPLETYRYLGLNVGASGAQHGTIREKLGDILRAISKSALLPQQRLWGLRVCGLPKFLHELVLGRPRRALLKQLDVSVRAAVRRWLHLPNDTPLGMFYAKARDGGLGLPCLEVRVPRLVCARFGSVRANDQALESVLVDAYGGRILERLTKTPHWNDRPILSVECEATVARTLLVESVDGRPFAGRLGSLTKNESRWVNDPVGMKVGGREFVNALHMRLGIVKTGERATRGTSRGSKGRLCRRCGVVQSLGHILGHCPWTHLLRCDRHDRFCNWIADALTRRGWRVVSERRIPLDGRRHLRPDLICFKSPDCLVLDPSIIGASSNPIVAFQSKVGLYDNDHVREHVKALAAEMNVRFENFSVHGIIVDNRGCWFEPSWSVLRRLGVPVKVLNYWTVRMLNRSHAMWSSEMFGRT